MWTYILIGVGVGVGLLLCFALAVASFSFSNFKEKQKELQTKSISYGITVSEFIKEVNRQIFGGQLHRTFCEQDKDHYSSNVISLSVSTYNSNSIVSFATTAHELGHAKQDYSTKKLQTLWKLKNSSRVCGWFFMPLIVVGFVLSLLTIFQIIQQQFVFYIGVGILGLAVVLLLFSIFLKIKEISIEKEASTIGLQFLKSFMTEKELKSCKDFLDSARFTYWAAFFRGLLGWTFLTNKESMFK
ncbi:MAG: zinc metallopeptidase [Clostridia bacterium]|nr:zinc metallopeptidase [Clostridia bacterium]